jgi:uroporphyrinogen decarboxylase
MTSRERVFAALAHRRPDRVPIDYQAKAEVTRRLAVHLGLPTEEPEAERALLDRLGCDFYYLSARDISQNETALPLYHGPAQPTNESERVCPFGIRFRRAVGADKFGADEAIRGPLEDASSAAEVLAHAWPRPQWWDPEPLLAECERFADKVIVGGLWSGIFGDCYRMHGFTNFLLNMAVNPEMIKALIGRMTDFYLELNERFFSRLKGRQDIFFMGNDFGTQGGMLFSPDMWDEFFRESYRRLIAHARGHGLKVMVHSCGAIEPLIGRFIELGVDIIDPVQTTAARMQAAGLKRHYGASLTFHGAIDTQSVLPRGTPEEVRRHCRETIETFGRDGGYIFVSCNSLQSDTPLENIDAMYAAAREHRFAP